MELFQKLGAEIEDSWREQNYNEQIFPTLASEALRRSDLPSKVSGIEIIEWMLKQPELPPQKDVHANFGDPPITLYNGPRFYIDVYFWLDGTTQIHQHSFCGAFQVLLGSSLHSWYDFKLTEVVNVYTEIGEMRLKVCELLKIGDVQEILAGRQYIHSLFHLDQPSATIVVRTIPYDRPQFSYSKPSLAIDPFFENDTITKKLQGISMLFQINHPDTDRLVSEMLEASDFQTCVSILHQVRGLVRGSSLGQLFTLDAQAKRFDAFLDIAVRRHGPKAQNLALVFEHRERLVEIVRRRNYVTNAEHRFFFALLLNVEERDRMLSLTKQRFPAADPVNKILDWSYDLAQTRVVGVNVPNALGIEGFGDVDLTLLENLLRGKSDAEAREAVASEYGERATAAETDEKLARLRESVIFRSLLSE